MIIKRYETERLYIERKNYNKEYGVDFIIYLKETNEEIGMVELYFRPMFYCDNKNLGFHLNRQKDFGKGYMTEATQALKHYIKKYKMEACAFDTNVGSNKVLQKIFPKKKEIEDIHWGRKVKINVYSF